MLLRASVKIETAKPDRVQVGNTLCVKIIKKYMSKLLLLLGGSRQQEHPSQTF